MALKITGRMKVKTLKSMFKNEFGLSLRVYDGITFANDDDTIAKIRKKEVKGGELSIARNMKVGNVEKKIEEMFGIKVQISGSDDSYLCNNDVTLAQALESDKKLMEKRGKRKNKRTDDNPNNKNDDKGGNRKRYFEIEVFGKRGLECSIGTLSSKNDKVANLLEKIESQDPDFDEMYPLGESYDTAFGIDNILHETGVDINDDFFSITVKELSEPEFENYLSENVLWEGGSDELLSVGIWDTGLEPFLSEEQDVAIVGTNYGSLWLKFLVVTDGENFNKDALIFTTLSLEEIIEDWYDVIASAYYVPEHELLNFIESLKGIDKEIYERLLDIYNNLKDNYKECLREIFDAIKDEIPEGNYYKIQDYLDNTLKLGQFKLFKDIDFGGHGSIPSIFIFKDGERIYPYDDEFEDFDDEFDDEG